MKKEIMKKIKEIEKILKDIDGCLSCDENCLHSSYTMTIETKLDQLKKLVEEFDDAYWDTSVDAMGDDA